MYNKYGLSITCIIVAFSIESCSSSNNQNSNSTPEDSILGMWGTICSDDSFDDTALSTDTIVTFDGTEQEGSFESRFRLFSSADCTGQTVEDETGTIFGSYFIEEGLIGAEGLIVNPIELVTQRIEFDDGLEIVPAQDDTISQTIFHIDQQRTLFFGILANEQENTNNNDFSPALINLDFDDPFIRL